MDKKISTADTAYLVAVILLVCFGCVMVYSASSAWALNDYADKFYWLKRHMVFVAVGLVGMTALSVVDMKSVKKCSPAFFVASVILLSLVPFIGKTVNGAKRWIAVGGVQLQPSEMAKLSLVLFLSYYISKYVNGSRDVNEATVALLNRPYSSSFSDKSAIFIREVLIPLCLIALVCVLTVLEKHMSATIILFCIGISVLFVGGVSFKWLGLLGAVGSLGAAYIIIFTDYTKARLDAWLHPEAHATGKGWQTLQSLYAIGSGGLFGVGIGCSEQKHMYLPEPQNDFIFAIICEELGFVGGVCVILLFALLIWRGFVIARRAEDSFSKLTAMGISCKIALQALLNIAVVTNTIPPTGISLPFFSYGGSALVILMCEAGIMLSISRHSYLKR